MRTSGGPFEEHIELLRLFLRRREEIIHSIEAVLNAQRKPARYLQDRPLLSRHFEDCFFERAAVSGSQTQLRGRLEEAYCAAGFKPRQVAGLHNDLIDPAEMMIRAFHCWEQTRWPGRNGRMHYAHTLFSLYLIRQLQFLSLHLWDNGLATAGDAHPAGGAHVEPGARLAEIQNVLDQIWRGSPAGQPVMVRDARWLIPLAQSLITDELAPYFEVARQVTDTLSEADALEIWKAHVRMLGGHLTSQIRYYCTKDGVPIDDRSVVLRTRTSNALDFSLLVQGLAILLKAYGGALQTGDEPRRLEIAGAILQGVSADPELFLHRLDLLSAYCMIEHVFIAADSAGQAAYSPQGQRQVEALKEYAALIGRLIDPLREDLPRFRPAEGRYSPFGVIFGLPSHLIEHMALKALQHDAESRFSLEDVFRDVFNDADLSAAKLAWVNGWRKLPHIDPQVQRLYGYPQAFAEEIYGRIERELIGPARGDLRTGRLHVFCGGASQSDAALSSTVLAIPELPERYVATTDKQLLRERREAHFILSYETPRGWIALKKELLTDVLGAGCDARVLQLPSNAVQALKLMCGDLVAVDSVR